MGPHVGCTCSVYRPVSLEMAKPVSEMMRMRFKRVLHELKIHGACLGTVLTIVGAIYLLA